jgi:hypothetical protein
MAYIKYTGHRKSYGAPKVEAGSRPNELLPQPNKYGEAILKELRSSNRNIAVRGVAGCGKTTMLRQIVASLTAYQRTRTTVIAFGSDIAKELKVVLPGDCDSGTAHSKGLKMLVKAGVNCKNVDGFKYNTILREQFQLSGYDFDSLGYDELNDTSTALNLCQLNLVDPKSDGFQLMLSHNGINPYQGMEDSIDKAINYGATDEGILRYGISFTDMIYLPIRKGLKPAYKYDLVLVDECQDLSNALAQIARLHMSENGRMVIVGDPQQAIFGFAGANPDSYNSLVDSLNAIELPLSVCYRCPKSHIAMANENLPDMNMESSESAVEGVITNHSYDDAIELLQALDLVVCRTNAPILGMAFALLKAGKQITVPGREITTQVAYLAKRILQDKPFSTLLDLTQPWLDEEVMKLAKRRNSEVQIATAQDKVECLTILVEKSMQEGVDSINKFIQYCKNLFPDKALAIKLCSVHKAKGLEAKRVFILQPELMPLKMPMKWQQEQELYLKNVALTRSKFHLGFIAKKKK